jgi:hypothetical protein
VFFYFNFVIRDFMSAILKNGREKRRRHFPEPAAKKVVKQVKAVSG